MKRRVVVGLMVAVVGAVVGLVAGTSAAGAHSQLTSSNPASGQVLESSPDQVLLEFNEPVEASLGGIRVFDTEARRVDDGEILRPGGDRTLATPLPDLDDGTYVVTFRVTSADSHPIDGAYTFQVGAATPTADTAALVDQLLAAEGGDPAAGGLYVATRALVFAGLAGFVGTLGYVLVVSPDVLSSARGRRLLRVSWGVLAAASAASIVLQGITAAALPLGDVVDPSVWSSVVDTRFGTLAALRVLILLTAGLPLIVPSRFRRSDRSGPGEGQLPGWWWPLAAVVSVAVVLTVALAGHAGSGGAVPFWAAVDGTHLWAMALWLGGLAILALVALQGSGDLPDSDLADDDSVDSVDSVDSDDSDDSDDSAGTEDSDDDAAVVDRFSTVAFACVVALAVTGSLQSWRQVGSLDALTSTTYGQTLLLKVFLVLVLVGVAAFSRSIVKDQRKVRLGAASRVVQPLSAGPGALAAGSGSGRGSGGDSGHVSDRTQLRGSVVAELAIGVAVLVASAFLVGLVPARDAVAEPFATVIEVEDLRIDVVVDPAAAGPVDVHLYVFGGGTEPVDVAELEATVTLAAEDIGPLELPLQRAGPNHFSAYDADLPIEGDWELRVSVRATGSGVVEGSTTVPIR